MRACTLTIWAFLVLSLCSSTCLPQKKKDKPAAGISDQVAPEPIPVVIPASTDVDAYFGSWTTIDDKGTFVPRGNFKDFGQMPMPMKASSENIYIIHFTDWIEDPATNKVKFVSSDWYTYRFDGTFKNLRSSGDAFPTTYDQKFGILLSVSRIGRPKGSKTPAPTIAYTLTATERTPDNILAFQALIGAITGVTFGGAAPAAGAMKAMALAPIEYDFAIQEFSTNSKALNAPFDLVFKATASSTIPGTDGKCYDLKVTSDCSFPRTVTVDDRYYFNAGVAIPFRGPRENHYDLDKNSAVEQTHTLHSAILATFDFSPWAKICSMTKCPYLQAGLRLSGSSFHAPYFGAAQPIPLPKKWLQISVFGGVMLMRQTWPNTLKIGDTTTPTAFNADLHTNWPIKGIYGVEVPVVSIVKSIKSSVK
jgi:hypothetical protein